MIDVTELTISVQLPDLPEGEVDELLEEFEDSLFLRRKLVQYIESYFEEVVGSDQFVVKVFDNLA